MPLNDMAIRSAKAGAKPLKMFDERGLFLLIQPTGGKLRRLKYVPPAALHIELTRDQNAGIIAAVRIVTTSPAFDRMSHSICSLSATRLFIPAIQNDRGIGSIMLMPGKARDYDRVMDKSATSARRSSHRRVNAFVPERAPGVSPARLALEPSCPGPSTVSSAKWRVKIRMLADAEQLAHLDTSAVRPRAPNRANSCRAIIINRRDSKIPIRNSRRFPLRWSR
ncbi:MAG: Arm DNA-binding domain-containing protein [Sphingomonas sp.]